MPLRLAVDHPSRERVLATIREHPGLSVSEYRTLLRMAHSSLNWHLDSLRDLALTREVYWRGRRFIFPIGTDPATAMLALAQRSPFHRAVLALLRSGGEWPPVRIARAVGCRRQDVRGRMALLVECGLVEDTGRPHRARYRLRTLGVA